MTFLNEKIVLYCHIFIKKVLTPLQLSAESAGIEWVKVLILTLNGICM